MKQFRKTFLGSVVSFVLGISCCWMSSLLVWLGGVAYVGSVTKLIESFQTQFILLSIFLALISMHLFFRK